MTYGALNIFVANRFLLLRHFWKDLEKTFRVVYLRKSSRANFHKDILVERSIPGCGTRVFRVALTKRYDEKFGALLLAGVSLRILVWAQLAAIPTPIASSN